MEYERDTSSYLTFAENDYYWFMDSYNRRADFPGLAACGQNICERYLKHILDKYYEPENRSEEAQKIDTLRTHNLLKLSSFIEQDMGIEIPNELSDELRSINGFYFTTRYPGNESMIPSKRDIDEVAKAVEATRDFVHEVIHEIEHDYDDWER